MSNINKLENVLCYSLQKESPQVLSLIEEALENEISAEILWSIRSEEIVPLLNDLVSYGIYVDTLSPYPGYDILAYIFCYDNDVLLRRFLIKYFARDERIGLPRIFGMLGELCAIKCLFLCYAYFEIKESQYSTTVVIDYAFVKMYVKYPLAFLSMVKTKDVTRIIVELVIKILKTGVVHSDIIEHLISKLDLEHTFSPSRNFIIAACAEDDNLFLILMKYHSSYLQRLVGQGKCNEKVASLISNK